MNLTAVFSPQTLNTAAGATKVTVYGKNLLNADGLIKDTVFDKSGSAYVFLKKGTGISNRSSAKAEVSLKANQKYTISFKCSSISPSAAKGNIRGYDSGGNTQAFAQTIAWADTNSATFTPTEDITAIDFYYSSGSGGVGESVTISEIQIEAGEIATDYEAYYGKREYTLKGVLLGISAAQ